MQNNKVRSYISKKNYFQHSHLKNSILYLHRVAAHTDEISDILKSRIFHTDTATVSNFTPIYTEIYDKSQPSLEIYQNKFVAVSASEVLTETYWNITVLHDVTYIYCDS